MKIKKATFAEILKSCRKPFTFITKKHRPKKGKGSYSRKRKHKNEDF